MCRRRTGPRALLASIAIAFAVVALAACGDSESSPEPAGSGASPPPAQTPEARAASGRSNEAAVPAGGEGAQPGYKELVGSQSGAPESRFSPCNLVTEQQARAILGGPIEQPLEAPQGPTCIYRGRGSFVTLAVQPVDLDKLAGRLRQRRQVRVSDRTGYCGHFGQDMLYVPVSRGRVLSIAGKCALARQFAAKAVRRLND